MKMLTILPHRTLNLETFVLLAGMWLGATLGHTQEAEFRAVGGPGLERGEFVVPHGTGLLNGVQQQIAGGRSIAGVSGPLRFKSRRGLDHIAPMQCVSSRSGRRLE